MFYISFLLEGSWGEDGLVQLRSTLTLEHRCCDLSFISLPLCVEDQLWAAETPASAKCVCEMRAWVTGAF